MNAAKIAELKALIGQKEKRDQRDCFNFSLWPEGFTRGEITELTGVGKTNVMIQFLSENPTLRVAWIEEGLTIYPCAIAQKKVALERLLFIEAKTQSDVLWASFQVLRSQFFECVVISLAKFIDEKNLRRLQLETEKGHMSLFLLSEKPHRAWPISLQLQVKHSGGGGHACGLFTFL